MRENYVPSWINRGSGANNVYGEQQSEYEEYAKYLNARSGASDESVSATAAAPEVAAAASSAAVPLSAEANEATSSPLLESSAPSTSEAEAEAAAAKAAWLARQGVASWNSQHRSEG